MNDQQPPPIGPAEEPSDRRAAPAGRSVEYRDDDP